MATIEIDTAQTERISGQLEKVGRGEKQPWATLRVTGLLLAIVPLLTGSALLVPVNSLAAAICGAAAGALVVAWPWWRMYRAMRENEREHPEERQRPWWQRWPWGSPPLPQHKTPVDRFFDVVGIGSVAGLGLMVLAWLCGIL